MKEKSESGFASPEGEAAIKREYERVLGAWPIPYERAELATSLGRTFVLACGGGPKPPIVLLHGTLSNSSMWIGEIAAFARERRVYALDLPGELGYSENRRASWQDHSYATWLAECIAGLGLDRPRIVGISLGAWVALSLATARPESSGARPGAPGGVALLCPSGIGPARLSIIPKVLWAGLRGERGRIALTRALFGDVPVDEEAIRIEALLAEHARARYGAPRRFEDAELAGLAMPVLLVVGGRDIMLDSRASAERMRRLCPEAKIIVAPGAGHALVGFAGEILEFFGASE